MFWLTILSSVASILSFGITIFDRFSKWRIYLLYSGFLTVGMAIGLILSSCEKTIQQFTTGQLFFIFSLVSFIVISIFIIYHSKQNFGIGGSAVLVLACIFVYLFHSFTDNSKLIESNECIILANYYTVSGDFGKAIKYLKEYKDEKDSDLSKPQKDNINKRVDSLQALEISKLK